ncbi:MAG: hypothetical protein L0K86_11305 [Actinomycetia bacterium]|nr:hypothetical protein [Actinomycetes bacterium]
MPTRWIALLTGVLGCVAMVSAAAGQTTFVGIPAGAMPGGVLLLLGALAVQATSRRRGRRRERILSVFLWVVAVVAVAASCFVLLDLIQLAVTGTVTDRDGETAWLAFAERLACALVGALLVAAATSWGRRIRGACLRCGRTHPLSLNRIAYPPAAAASKQVNRIAYVGCLAFVPYLTLHGLHAAGLAPWLDDLYSGGGVVHSIWGFVAFATGLVGPATFLLLGLVRPWGMAFPRWCLWLAGRRVPRFLPLVPVWLVAPTLVLYGIGSVFYGVVSGHDLIGLGGAASLAFGGYGSALGVAALSYQRRTRPVCVQRHEPRTTVAASGR